MCIFRLLRSPDAVSMSIPSTQIIVFKCHSLVKRNRVSHKNNWFRPMAWNVHDEAKKLVHSKPRWGTISCQSEWLLSKSLQAINAGEGGCGEKGTLLHCWWECKLVQPLWRTVWRFLKKLELELPYDPAYTLKKPELKETHVPQCSSQHCLQ